MAMDMGWVTIDEEGNANGTGASFFLYEEFREAEVDDHPLLDPAVPDADWEGSAAAWVNVANSVNLKRKQDWARQARRVARLIPYIQDHAVVSGSDVT